eukprot:1660399-Pyramimonas_sp.AAC.1
MYARFCRIVKLKYDIIPAQDIPYRPSPFLLCQNIRMRAQWFIRTQRSAHARIVARALPKSLKIPEPRPDVKIECPER